MVSVKINGEEVRNPVLRLLISIGAFLAVLLILALLFLIFLPFVWFIGLIILTAVVLPLLLGPKILRDYRIVVIEKENQPPTKRIE